MKPFDLEAAKQGAAVCTRSGRIANILSFDGHKMSFDSPEPVAAEFIDGDGFEIGFFSRKGEWVVGGECDEDLLMRDDDYLERLERGEHGDHIADVGKMVTPTVEEKLTVATCKESLPVGLTKREWFAGMAMQGLCASVGANHGAGFIGAWATSIADALIAELEKNG